MKSILRGKWKTVEVVDIKKERTGEVLTKVSHLPYTQLTWVQSPAPLSTAKKICLECKARSNP